jgi:hypothetical protein
MTDQTTSKGRGCLFYGCLTLFILMLIGGVVGYFGVRYAIKTFTQLVEKYTDSSAASLPTVQISSERLQALKQRVAEFQKAIDEQKAGQTLALTADEINGLIVHDARFKDFKDRLFVSIEGDKVKGQLSLPLDALAEIPVLSKLKGRYLNGAATLKASLANGVLIVTLDAIEVKGQPLPEEFVAELRKQNLAQDLYKNPESAETVRKFESILVKDGQIIIKTKAKNN